MFQDKLTKFYSSCLSLLKPNDEKFLNILIKREENKKWKSGAQDETNKQNYYRNCTYQLAIWTFFLCSMGQ